MIDNLIARMLPEPNPGEAVFVRALEEKHIRQLLTKGFDSSRDNRGKRESVVRMLNSAGLGHLASRQFVCTYAFTARTWKYFKPRVSSMSACSNVAVVLDPEKLSRDQDLWVFNDDLQNLADKRAEAWWFRQYAGNMSEIAQEIDSRIQFDKGDNRPQRIYSQVCEGRLFSRLTPEHILRIYFGGKNKDEGMHWALELESMVKRARTTGP